MADETTQNPITPEVKDEHHHLGPIIGILIVVLVLVLGGLYIWGSQLAKDAATSEVVPRSIDNNEPETPRAEADATILITTSTSDELDAIEADIESTNLDSLDAELDEIDRELNAGN